MKLIDSYTPVEIQVETSIPESAAVVVFTAGENADVFGDGLPADVRDAMELMAAAKSLPKKANEIATQATAAKRGRLVIAGSLGDRKTISLQSIREAAAAVAKWARKQEIGHVAFALDSALPIEAHEAAAACATGLCLGYFQFTAFKGDAKTKASGAKKLAATIVIAKSAKQSAAGGVERASILARSQNFARAVAGHPGNVMHPVALEKLVRAAAKECGLGVRVLDEREMAKLGMGGVLAVGMGSPQTPPRMIVLEWKGQASRDKGRANTQHTPVLLVGKAITFDTGGISIKPREGMQRMVFDKCGAMAVLGTMIALARLNAPQRVIGILSAAENHVSATAYRPGDILTMYNGVTVEVTNTDAEGRLVLADALAWGIETYKPAAVVDLATLTGGVVIALGKEFAGVFANNDNLADELKSAGEFAGEKMWRLPISEEAKEMMKSDHADIVNSAGRHAHAIQGAEFLRRFIPEDGRTPWVHLDIAGVADNEKATPLYSPGATGWGVRTLVHWILSR